jgi:hypothetical protein
MSLKVYVLEAGSPLWHYWKVVEPLKGGAQWEDFRSWGVSLKQIMVTPPPSAAFSSLFAPWL